MYYYFNPNPCQRNVGDCSVRAICKALGMKWEQAYMALCDKGLELCDMPSSNLVWGTYLKEHGFRKKIVPATCMDYCTVYDFCREFPWGTYVLALSGHVVCVEDGKIYDSWDSSNEAVLYYWEKE